MYFPKSQIKHIYKTQLYLTTEKSEGQFQIGLGQEKSHFKNLNEMNKFWLLWAPKDIWGTLPKLQYVT